MSSDTHKLWSFHSGSSRYIMNRGKYYYCAASRVLAKCFVRTFVSFGAATIIALQTTTGDCFDGARVCNLGADAYSKNT